MKLDQREPTRAAVEKGLAALLDSLNDRAIDDRRWRISSPPDRIELSRAVGSWNADLPGVVGPDDQGPVVGAGTPWPLADEDAPDQTTEEAA